MLPLKAGNRKCKNHVFRFYKYVGEFNYTVHPRSKDRFPKLGQFKCTECGAINIYQIKHRS